MVAAGIAAGVVVRRIDCCCTGFGGLRAGHDYCSFLAVGERSEG